MIPSRVLAYRHGASLDSESHVVHRVYRVVGFPGDQCDDGDALNNGDGSKQVAL